MMIPKMRIWYCIILVVVSIKAKVLCSIYKVGDLDAWGIPTSSNQQIYTKWIKNHNIKIGDSIFFLYPPSQDSVIQVTSDSYKKCNTKDPILYMDNGNSLFNITNNGDFYFTSGAQGHCEKLQKIHISVGTGNGSDDDEDSTPASGPAASAPSYPTVFGSIPVQSASASSSASSLIKVSIFLSAATGFFIFLLVN